MLKWQINKITNRITNSKGALISSHQTIYNCLIFSIADSPFHQEWIRNECIIRFASNVILLLLFFSFPFLTYFKNSTTIKLFLWNKINRLFFYHNKVTDILEANLCCSLGSHIWKTHIQERLASYPLICVCLWVRGVLSFRISGITFPVD